MSLKFIEKSVSLGLGILILLCVPPVSTLAQDAREEVAGNSQVAEIIETFAPRGVQSDGSTPTPPLQALESFRMQDGFSIDLVASEPNISQPLFLSWDSRGRMWVVQYRQYQFPAGLKVVRYDHHLRAVFDRVPMAPPNHVRGKDRISVLEDTNGDGTYDTQKDVIDGLNIATSVAVGRGGIWVLNPPYLLFYPDENRDDIPDREPIIHLSGFGLQDTHSVANSLMWGPDGWLYGANGSTTGGTVSSARTKGISFQGQCIWRYHPESQIFEIYAEGGGNTFSLDIDAAGRVFCGTNGGNTRGWYLPQGSYSRKNWGKHGPLTNPYAFGFFEAMEFEGDGRRFPQAFLIYEGGLFPKREFEGSIIAPNAMQNLIWHSRRIAQGSTYRTVDNANLLECSDRWFRPVYAGVGPDGAVYVADWYDTRLSHVSPTDDWHKTSGRVYRIRPSDSAPRYKQGDLHLATDEQLIASFDHENKWVRQRSTLELGWRKQLEPKSLDTLIDLVDSVGSLEALWALHQQHALTSELSEKWLSHTSPHIRRWIVRLLGDRHEDHSGLITLAANETDIQVRSQLAASARRLSATTGLAIVRGLLQHSDDAADPHMPLMIWWAIESHAEDWHAIESFLQEPSAWASEFFKRGTAENLMQRYAADGSKANLLRCERLLEIAPDEASRESLAVGLNKAYQGRTLPPLPARLASELKRLQAKLGESGIVLAVQQGNTEVYPKALAMLRDDSTELLVRMELAKALAQVSFEPAKETLLRLAIGELSNEPALQRVALAAIANFDGDAIAARIAKAFDSSISAEHDLRNTGCRTLASRQSWALSLLEEVNNWRLKASDIPPDVVQRLRTYSDHAVQSAVITAFGEPSDISSPEKVAEIVRLEKLLSNGLGSAKNGAELFKQKCASCHRLFGEGAELAPALDNYDRSNLKFWLPAIVAPSIEVREGYQTFLALKENDLVVTGMIHAQTTQSVTIRTADGQLVLIPTDELQELRALETSLMPDNILETMSDEEVTDLFTHLRSNLVGTTQTAPEHGDQ